jgi:hypothetical protein
MRSITRIEAARRQLDQAIELFFAGGDAVSIHSLSLNAFEIAATLAKNQDAPNWLDMTRQDAAEHHGIKTEKEFFDIFNKARNFFKHAGRKPDEALPDFDESMNDHSLALTVFQYGELAERSAPMWAYLFWFYATHPIFLVPAALENEVAPYREAASLARKAQLEIGRKILEDVQSRLRS